MTIASIIQNRKGTSHAWRVYREDSTDLFVGTEYALYHYGTEMLRWIQRSDGAWILGWSLGHGSVSDQNGMNTAFRILNLRYYMDRDAKGGGPRFRHLDCGKAWVDCECENDQLWGNTQ